MRRGIFTLFAMLAMMLTASNVYGEATVIFENDDYKITKDGNEYVLTSLNENGASPTANDNGWVSNDAKSAFLNIKAPDNAKLTVSGKFNGLEIFNNNQCHFKSLDLKEMDYIGIGQLSSKFQHAETVVLPDNWTFDDFNPSIWPSLNGVLNGMDHLKDVTFGSGLTTIPAEILQNNNKLETVTFSEGVDSIGKNAFNNCPKLATINFPQSLVGIGPDAFNKCTSLTSLDLASLPNLRSINYQAFEYCSNLSTVTLPASLKYFANQVFADTNIEILDFSGCPLITEFTSPDRPTFKWYDTLKTLILPPNLKSLCQEACMSLSNLETVTFGKCATIGKYAFKTCPKLTTVTFPSDLEEIGEEAFMQCPSLTSAELTSCLTIGKKAFYECTSLASATFPTNLETIKEQAFYKSVLEKADMSKCHDLTLIEGQAFAEIRTALKEVIFCSHPKTITGGSGGGAFYNCSNIQRVEVKYCSGTDVTECVCQSAAFDYDVTFKQTQVENIELAAKLVFSYSEDQDPDGNIAEGSKYTSAFDFFVGDYKAGVVISQANLNNYWKGVPGEYGYQDLDPDKKYANNGWLEFVNIADPIPVVTPGQFIRTYSRTEGAGAVLLPLGETKTENNQTTTIGGVHAYRAVDYVAGVDAGGNPTVDNGFIRLRELKVEINETKMVQKIDPETNEPVLDPTTNEPIYEEKQVKVEYSYVPENTGVVLYSPNISEGKGILILKPYENEDDLTKYPNTGERFEETADDKDINMLEGSYGNKKKVAPVFPWNWKGRCYYPDGSSKQRKYRNFGLQIGETNPVQTSRWRRFTPSTDDDATKLRENRAYAQLPVARFFSDNETWQNGNLLNIEDSGQSNNMGIGFVFEDEVTGIKTVSSNNSDMMEDNTWYTIQGVKVANPTKGVYIYNHKKVVIK